MNDLKDDKRWAQINSIDVILVRAPRYTNKAYTYITSRCASHTTYVSKAKQKKRKKFTNETLSIKYET